MINCYTPYKGNQRLMLVLNTCWAVLLLCLLCSSVAVFASEDISSTNLTGDLQSLSGDNNETRSDDNGRTTSLPIIGNAGEFFINCFSTKLIAGVVLCPALALGGALLAVFVLACGGLFVPGGSE